jgi:hypothetical protein
MNEQLLIDSLRAAISRETDPKAREDLQTELDRYLNNRVKRARAVPETEAR